MASDPNPLVASGEYMRAYVCELTFGDVNAFGEVVNDVIRHDDQRTTVRYISGREDHFRRSDSTMLIREEFTL